MTANDITAKILSGGLTVGDIVESARFGAARGEPTSVTIDNDETYLNFGPVHPEDGQAWVALGRHPRQLLEEVLAYLGVASEDA